MRVLYICKTDDEDNTTLTVSDIIHANYCEDLNESVHEGNCGLYLLTPDNDSIEVPNLSEETCNNIIRELFLNGTYDLSNYDAYLI